MSKSVARGLACAILAAVALAPVLGRAADEVAAEAARDRQARALVMERCTLCHGTREICENLGRKGKDGWDQSVSLMMLKGAPVGAQQKALIVDWLWDLPQGSAPLCPGKK